MTARWRHARVAVVTALLTGACDEPPQAIPPEELVIARVDGQDVKRGLFESYLRYGVQLNQAGGDDDDDTRVTALEYSDEVHSRLLDRFLLERALAQSARRDGATVTPAQLDGFAQSTGIGNIDAIEDGMPLTQREYLLGYLEDSLLVKRHIERRALARTAPTDDEAVAWYEQNIDHYTEPARVRLRQIRVETLVASRELKAAVGRKRDPDKFLAHAAKLNEQDDEEQGKDLGVWPLNRLPDDFAEAISKVDAGQLSEVFQDTDGAYNMLLVEERHDERIVPFAEIRDRVLAELDNDRRSSATRQYMAEIRAGSVIELFPANLGFTYQPVADPPAAAATTESTTDSGAHGGA